MLAPRAARLALLGRVLLVAVTLACVAGTWGTYVEIEPSRWLALHHDRNTHFDQALELTVAARHLDPARFVAGLEDARQWPPLHAVLAATSMLALGVRAAPVAVLPNLLAFAATALLAFDLARRLCRDRGRGVAAGLFAWSTVLSSPAHQAFGTDLMLESLGAALTLLALDAWVAWRQTGERRAARALAFALSALLFEKYNYYLLVIAGLGAASFARSPADFVHVVSAARSFLRGASTSKTPPLSALSALSPLRRVGARVALAIGACALVVAAWTLATGGTAFELLGRRVSLHSPSGPLTFAWAAMLVSLAFVWKPTGRRLFDEMTPFARTLSVGHGLPLALFGLLPGRLDQFASYVSPTNTPTASAAAAETLEAFARWWTGHYTPFAGAAIAAFALACIATFRRRDDALIRAVASFVGVGALLILLHPHHQSRFLHTWIAGVWILGGVGLACAAGVFGHSASRFVAIAAAVVWTALHVPHMAGAGRSQGAEYAPHGASTLEIAARIDDARNIERPIAFVTRLPMQAVLGWIVKSSLIRPDAPLHVAPADLETPEALESWLAGIDRPRVVVIDLDASAPVPLDPNAVRSRGPDLVPAIEGLRHVATTDLPAHGARVSVFDPRR